MRGLVVLSCLLLFAGVVGAQDVETLRVSAEPFAGPVAPLRAAISTVVTAEASCALFDERASIPIGFVVTTSPAWATVVLSPAGPQHLAITACDQGWVRASATVIVSASDQAPAFAPTPIVVETIAGPAGREVREEVEVALEASFFSVLDVQLPVTMANVEPGGEARFDVTLTNFGNGPTKVAFEIIDGADALTVALPEPVTLGSKQAGSNDVSTTVAITARAPQESGFVNRVETFSVRATSAYASDSSLVGEMSTLSFIVNVKSGTAAAVEERSPTPLPALLALLAVPLAALLRRR